MLTTAHKSFAQWLSCRLAFCRQRRPERCQQPTMTSGNSRLPITFADYIRTRYDTICLVCFASRQSNTSPRLSDALNPTCDLTPQVCDSLWLSLSPKPLPTETQVILQSERVWKARNPWIERPNIFGYIMQSDDKLFVSRRTTDSSPLYLSEYWFALYNHLMSVCEKCRRMQTQSQNTEPYISYTPFDASFQTHSQRKLVSLSAANRFQNFIVLSLEPTVNKTTD